MVPKFTGSRMHHFPPGPALLRDELPLSLEWYRTKCVLVVHCSFFLSYQCFISISIFVVYFSLSRLYLRAFNELWEPEILNRVHPSMRPAFEISNHLKVCLLSSQVCLCVIL